MQITDMLGQTGGIESIARELGISTSDAARGAAALAPAILGGFKKQSQSAGRHALGDLLGQLGGASLFDDVVSPQSTDVDRGDNVLGRIFGSKDVSRDIAESASAQTGLDQGLLKQMLPRLAMLVAGHMAKQNGAAASRGGLGVLLGGLGGRRDEAGEAGLASMLDLGGDGNPLDDILQKVARARR